MKQISARYTCFGKYFLRSPNSNIKRLTELSKMDFCRRIEVSWILYWSGCYYVMEVLINNNIVIEFQSNSERLCLFDYLAIKTNKFYLTIHSFPTRIAMDNVLQFGTGGFLNLYPEPIEIKK